MTVKRAGYSLTGKGFPINVDSAELQEAWNAPNLVHDDFHQEADLNIGGCM